MQTKKLSYEFVGASLGSVVPGRMVEVKADLILNGQKISVSVECLYRRGGLTYGCDFLTTGWGADYPDIDSESCKRVRALSLSGNSYLFFLNVFSLVLPTALAYVKAAYEDSGHKDHAKAMLASRRVQKSMLA